MRAPRTTDILRPGDPRFAAAWDVCRGFAAMARKHDPTVRPPVVGPDCLVGLTYAEAEALARETVELYKAARSRSQARGGAAR